jgi:hypothetical protein
VFFIILLFRPRVVASADNANTARFRLRKANQQEVLRRGMSNDDLAEFFRGVPLVRENPRQRIAESRNRLGEAHVVLAVVGSGFARVLFEYQRHRVSLQNSEIVSLSAGWTLPVAASPSPCVVFFNNRWVGPAEYQCPLSQKK